MSDARQLNPTIPDTLAGKIAALNSNLAGQEYVLLDLDTLTDSSQNGYTKSCTNVPPGTGNGYLEVVSNKRGLALQRYTPYSSNTTYIRQMLADGTWGSWKTQLDNHLIVQVKTSSSINIPANRGVEVVIDITPPSGYKTLLVTARSSGFQNGFLQSLVFYNTNVTLNVYNPTSTAYNSAYASVYVTYVKII